MEAKLAQIKKYTLMLMPKVLTLGGWYALVSS